VHLKELEHFYQNTSNEALFYLIRNNVLINLAYWFVTGNLSVHCWKIKLIKNKTNLY